MAAVACGDSAICPAERGIPPVAVVIPAWNEQDSIGRVIEALPKVWAQRIVVADNGSTDRTAEVAQAAGATVVPAPRRGYGSACLAALAFLQALPPEQQPQIVAFIDADFADFPEQLPLIAGPIALGQADLVIGSRMLKPQPPGALLPQAVFGNKLACLLMRILFRQRYTDLGPFRAIRWQALKDLNMTDTNFGWTVEMQIKAAKRRLRVMEVAVDYRPRIGCSKISGTILGSIRAGYKILYTIFRHAWG
ncbi:MAG TPA: glycosyltransferase family 2 protein [Tepidisphaeraceae bacterium]|nr:glycosyltransferase family 2 protein [Tepidisphaeraceae bacterium]